MTRLSYEEKMERVLKYDYNTLKRVATKWLGKGWRNCNSWASMEELKLAKLCKRRLDWFEFDEIPYCTWERYLLIYPL